MNTTMARYDQLGADYGRGSMLSAVHTGITNMQGKMDKWLAGKAKEADVDVEVMRQTLVDKTKKAFDKGK